MAQITVFVVAILALVNLYLTPSALGCGYASCPTTYDTSKVQLHIISHSHDDVGWLTTPDGYADNDVNPLLSAVVEALQKNKNRKFVEVEMYYFKRWWQRQSKDTQDQVKQLVKSGQLAFANGGWCMNDEASTHYNQIIDQMTLGIQFLREQFGDCAEPKLSWHIDPFGASREQANLFSQMGFDGHVTNRGNGNLQGEFMWNTSLGHSIFTSRLHNHYSAPGGFNFEDADEITEANKLDKAKTLAELGKNWNRDYGSKGHVLITFGDDFRYKNAERWFSNLDKLIEVVNKEHPDVHLQYSSPHCYIKAIRDLKDVKLPVKSEDYFPLWTGHYSSRPQVKYLDRYANNLLQTAKQLEVIAELGNTQALLWEGKQELGVLQHHDAVPGTSRPSVMIDYKERLVSAIKAVQSVISQALDKLTKKSDAVKSTHRPYVYTTVNISDFVQHLDSQAFATIIYNPVVQEEVVWVRIPVSDHTSYKVLNSAGEEVKNVAVVPISNKVKSLLGHHRLISHELVFEAKLPALGFTTFFVSKGTDKLVENRQALQTNADQDFVLQGKNIQLVVDHKTGKIKHLIKDKQSHKLVQTFAYYQAHHSSSAYEFCPSSGALDLSDYGSSVVHAAKYEGFAEVTQKVNDWVWQTIRVYEDKEYVEFDWVVGPVSDENLVGKEVISRFDTELASKGAFYTDSNGRQSIQRIRNDELRECHGTRNAISYNYYPITTRASLKDETTGLELTLITDRSVGAASLADGQLELMVHRRLFDNLDLDIHMNDLDVDGKGVVARGNVKLFLSAKTEAADQARQASRNVFLQPVIAFSPIESTVTEYTKSHNVQYTALKSKLPENVNLLTLENWGSVTNNEVLVRFENFYQPDDVSKLNVPAQVPFDIFANLKVDHVEKANLIVGGRSTVTAAQVTITAQELNTFVYKVSRNVSNSACGLKWEKLINHRIPSTAIRAGHELDNTPLYVCRHKNGDLIPGKYAAGIKCHISYGGGELGFDDNEVELLTASSDAHYQWVPRHGGDAFPEQAFVSGSHPNGVPIYVGRCVKYGVVVGKIDEYFYYAYSGGEHRDCIDHEILTC